MRTFERSFVNLWLEICIAFGPICGRKSPLATGYIGDVHSGRDEDDDSIGSHQFTRARRGRSLRLSKVHLSEDKQNRIGGFVRLSPFYLRVEHYARRGNRSLFGL